MKKIILLLAAFSLGLAATGCGDKAEDVDMGKIAEEQKSKGQGSQNVPTQGIDN